MTTSKKKRFSYATEALLEEPVLMSEQAEVAEAVETSERIQQPEQEVTPLQPEVKAPQARGRNKTSASRAEPAEVAAKPKKTAKQKESPEPVLMSEPSEVEIALKVGNLEGLLQPPQQRGKRDTEGTGRMSIPREQTTIRLRPELKRAAAAAAALEGITLGDLIERVLIKHLSE